jgi:NADH-quinone oxidoreductase subunit B
VPPRPDAFLEGLLLRDSIGKEKRPQAGPPDEGVMRPEKISIRDLKNAERMKMGNIRPMDEI